MARVCPLRAHRDRLPHLFAAAQASCSAPAPAITAGTATTTPSATSASASLAERTSATYQPTAAVTTTGDAAQLEVAIHLHADAESCERVAAARSAALRTREQ